MNKLLVCGTVRTSRPLILDVRHVSAEDAEQSQDLTVCVQWPLSRPEPGDTVRIVGVPTFQRDDVMAILAFSVERIEAR